MAGGRRDKKLKRETNMVKGFKEWKRKTIKQAVKLAVKQYRKVFEMLAKE